MEALVVLQQNIIDPVVDLILETPQEPEGASESSSSADLSFLDVSNIIPSSPMSVVAGTGTSFSSNYFTPTNSINNTTISIYQSAESSPNPNPSFLEEFFSTPKTSSVEELETWFPVNSSMPKRVETKEKRSSRKLRSNNDPISMENLNPPPDVEVLESTEAGNLLNLDQYQLILNPPEDEQQPIAGEEEESVQFPILTPDELEKRLRKRVVTIKKRLLLPKKKKRVPSTLVPEGDAGDNDNLDGVPTNNIFLNSENSVSSFEVPESGMIYENGMVWEERPLPFVVCKTNLGILKGTKRTRKMEEVTNNNNNNVEPEDYEDVEQLMDSPSKKARMLSFSSEDPHVRFYHSPALLYKRRPVVRRTKKGKGRGRGKKLALPTETETETNSSVTVEAKGNIEIDTEATSKTQEIEDVVSLEPSTSGTGQVIINDQQISPRPSVDSPSKAAKLEPDAPVVLFFANADTKNANRPDSNPINFSFSMSEAGIPKGNSSLNASTISGDTEIPSTSNTAAANGTDMLGAMSMSEEASAEFVNSETGNYSKDPAFPLLHACTDPIRAIIPRLAHSTMRKALKKILETRGILTIGQLSMQTEVDITNWPLSTPRYKTLCKALNNYYQSNLLKELKTEKSKSTRLESTLKTEPVLEKVSPIPVPNHTTVEEDYLASLKTLNSTMDKLKDGKPESPELSQEIVKTSLRLVQSMDKDLLTQFLLKLVHHD